MTCERYDYLIEAYIDGECSVDEAESVREHLRVCAACRTRADRLSTLQELIHRTLSAETPSPGLWQRIVNRLDQDEAATADARPKSAWGRMRRLAAAAAIVAALVTGGFVLWPHAPSEHAVVRETVQDFVTFQLSGRPFDNEASDPMAVRAWFAGKIRFELPAMKARAAGYALVGSRLCWLLDRRLGAFTYRRGDRFMTLYVMDGEALELRDSGSESTVEPAAIRHQIGDYNSLIWRQDNLVFSLVSNAPQQEMTAFAATVLGDGHQRAARVDRVAGSAL